MIVNLDKFFLELMDIDIDIFVNFADVFLRKYATRKKGACLFLECKSVTRSRCHSAIFSVSINRFTTPAPSIKLKIMIIQQ
jgi:hypothetical protein